MAHDAKMEDYQRLGLRFIHELDGNDPVQAMKAFSGFGKMYATDRDSLPQTDADRAFHLVQLACEVVDYQLPFALGTKAGELIERGKNLLDEALALDPDCFDAMRMRSSTRLGSVSSRYAFLAEEEPRVREACERARVEAASDESADRAELAADLAWRPYLRWLASMADEALVCGRNKQAVSICEKLLLADPKDCSDARFTLALALAKLEDEAALEELERRYPQIYAGRAPNDAWMLIARLALAHKRHDMDACRQALGRLMETYPTGAVALIRQNELPCGEFARLHTREYSEDELVVALSEAVVLLQEGDDPAGHGVLGSWISDEVKRLKPRAAVEARKIEDELQVQLKAEGGEEL